MHNFLPFYPLNNPKNGNFKKNEKKLPGDIILHKCTKKSWSYATLFLRYGVWCNCYFSFWATFCPFTPNSPKNQNFTNMKKTPGDIILHMCTKKMMMYVDNDDVWLDDAWFLRYGAQRMDGRTKKKWHIEMGVPPKNYTRKNYTVLRNS